jgi:hypothetical protein
MNNSSLLILSLIAFMLIAYYLYYNVFELMYSKKIHPLINQYKKDFNKKSRIIEKQVVWTYIEDPIFFDQDYYIQLLEKKKNVPILFNFCLQILNNKINKDFNDLIVISPNNIKHYLPDFPIEMNAQSKYTQKFRVDLLASFLLSKYGGLFVSPGTVVLKDLDEIMYNLKFKYDLITFGGSVRHFNSCENKYNPGNYVIGAKPNNPTMLDYKNKMVNNLKSKAYVDKLVSEDLLSYSIMNNNPTKYFHFNCEYTGNVDLKNNIISLDHYFGYEPIDFKNEENLIFIVLPYDLILHDKKHYWINNLSKKQFVEANNNITEIISKEIYEINK